MARFSTSACPACHRFARRSLRRLRPPPRTPRTSSACSRARSSCTGRRHARRDRRLQGRARHQPPTAPTRSRTSAPPTFDSGSSTTRSSSTSGAEGRPGEHAVRLNLALAYYKSARPAARRSRNSSASSRRIPRPKSAYLMLADCYSRPVRTRMRVAAAPARADVRRRSRLRVSARDGAPSAPTKSSRAEIRRSRVRRRRVRRGAPADGHRAPRAQDYPAAEDGARTRGQAQSRSCRRRTRSTAARCSRSASRTPPSGRSARARAERQRLRGQPAARQHPRSAQRFDDASTYLERAMTIRPDDLTARKLPRQPATADRQDRRGRRRCSKPIVKDAPDLDRRPRPARDRLQPAQADGRCAARTRDRRPAERRSAGQAARGQAGGQGRAAIAPSSIAITALPLPLSHKPARLSADHRWHSPQSRRPPAAPAPTARVRSPRRQGRAGGATGRALGRGDRPLREGRQAEARLRRGLLVSGHRLLHAR